ncbi:MAG: EcsC family protein [Nocardioides sp.]|uniref:EcsC family protein n=1 Tax=Nocardioides sp. TaxID=35761 RepID=UPI003F0B2C9D
MGARSKALASLIGTQVAPRLGRVAPSLTSTFVREALVRAIDGVGPLPGAAEAAEAALAARNGDEVRAVHDLIEANVRLAGGQGFLTNVGGLLTAPIAIPANIAGVVLIQLRMVAGIAHLRGHDLADPAVRSAVMASLLGQERVGELVTAKRLPGPPGELAESTARNRHTDALVASEVASDLITRVAGKQLVSTVGRRIPVVGGVFGAGADGYATWRVGRYADAEFLSRRVR